MKIREHKATISFNDDLLTKDDLKTELKLFEQRLTIKMERVAKWTILAMFGLLGLLFAALQAFPQR